MLRHANESGRRESVPLFSAASFEQRKSLECGRTGEVVWKIDGLSTINDNVSLLTMKHTRRKLYMKIVLALFVGPVSPQSMWLFKVSLKNSLSV